MGSFPETKTYTSNALPGLLRSTYLAWMALLGTQADYSSRHSSKGFSHGDAQTASTR